MQENAIVAAYCFYFSTVLELVRSGTYAMGFVSFHGELATPETQDNFCVPRLFIIFHGTSDRIVTMVDFAALSGDFEKVNVPHEMISSGSALHSFTVFGRPC